MEFAQGLGAQVTAEVAPQHFSKTEALLLTQGSNAKMNPPLRLESDRRAVIEGLKSGVITVIATDHAPHHADEKKCRGYHKSAIWYDWFGNLSVSRFDLFGRSWGVKLDGIT